MSRVTIDDILAANAQFGPLDIDLVRKAMAIDNVLELRAWADNDSDPERAIMMRMAADEIERLRKMTHPSVWTCSDVEGESWSCPDDAMDGAGPGDSSELDGWARVAAVKATVQADNSVQIENLI